MKPDDEIRAVAEAQAWCRSNPPGGFGDPAYGHCLGMLEGAAKNVVLMRKLPGRIGREELATTLDRLEYVTRFVGEVLAIRRSSRG